MLGGNGLTYATKQSNKDDFILINHDQQVFSRRNIGKTEGLTNNCMFISIHQYLTSNLDYKGSVRDIRRIARLEGKYEDDMFDDSNNDFITALELLANRFNLDIRIWYVNNENIMLQYNIDIDNNKATPAPRYGKGNKNVINIKYNREHFELITHGSIFINDEQIRQNEQNRLTEQSLYTEERHRQYEKYKQNILAEQIRHVLLLVVSIAVGVIWKLVSGTTRNERRRLQSRQAEQIRQAQEKHDEDVARNIERNEISNRFYNDMEIARNMAIDETSRYDEEYARNLARHLDI